MSMISDLRMNSEDSGHRVSYSVKHKPAHASEFDSFMHKSMEFLFSEDKIEEALLKYKEILEEIRGEEKEE